MNNEFNFQDFFSPSGAEVNIIPVMTGDPVPQVEEKDLPEEIPILALRNAVIFPGTIFPITIGREKSIRLVDDAQKKNAFIAAIPQAVISVEDPANLQDFNEYGTVCKVMKTFEMPDGTISALLQGYRRVHLDALVETEPYHWDTSPTLRTRRRTCPIQRSR